MAITGELALLDPAVTSPDVMQTGSSATNSPN
jgi:hypothetical protein